MTTAPRPVHDPTSRAPRTGDARTTAQAGPRPNGGPVGLVALAALTQLRASLRTPEFAVGAVGVPLLLYAMFGLTNASAVLPGGTSVGLAMLVSMSAYGVVSLAIFTFGEDVAKERGRGWTRTLRATPLPTSVHLAAKIADALVLAVVVVAAMSVLAATAAGVSMPATTWLALGATMVSGVLLFSTLGFAIAFVARPRAAAVIANLVFLPLSFASGFFVPLSDLPEVLRDVAAFLPTFHFGQLAYGVAMPAADVEAWTAAAGRPVWVHLAWVLGSAIALGALALWAARRESVTRRG